MRWITDNKTPDAGDTRKVERFLFLPMKIGNETRWLEFATILEEAYIGWSCAPGGPAFKCLKWRPAAFLG